MILGKTLKFLLCLLSFEKGLDMYFIILFVKKKAFLTIKMPFSDSRKIRHNSTGAFCVWVKGS